MDTSAEYIEMCRKATEIRASHTPQIGDWYHTPIIDAWYPNNDPEPENRVVCEGDEHERIYNMLRPWAGYCDPSNYDNVIKESVWLPRQDQLQERCQVLRNCGALGFTDAMSFFVRQLRKSRILSSAELLPYFKCPEQLLLAMLMHDEFNKSWDGKEWVDD